MIFSARRDVHHSFADSWSKLGVVLTPSLARFPHPRVAVPSAPDIFLIREYPMGLGEYVSGTIIVGFGMGAVLHVTCWVLTRGVVWIGNILEGRDVI